MTVEQAKEVVNYVFRKIGTLTSMIGLVCLLVIVLLSYVAYKSKDR